MSNIKIVALVTVKPEYTETLKPLFQSLVKASRAEEGNISYDCIRKSANPSVSSSSKTGNPKQLSTRTTPANISKVSSKPSTAKPMRSKSF